ncbi:MAG: hypothetical protein H0X39_05480 [Actinobacteria bacterium]|nr:hypothetical protein [Actinomycetota bacterium]
MRKLIIIVAALVAAAAALTTVASGGSASTIKVVEHADLTKSVDGMCASGKASSREQMEGAIAASAPADAQRDKVSLRAAGEPA